MAKVVVLRRPYESGRMKTGLGRYADVVQRHLADREPDVITMDLSLKKGVFNLLTNGLIRPFFRVCNNRNDTFHATDELCGVMFPFIRGRKIVTVHHVITDGESGRAFSGFWHFVTRIALRRADRIISISDPTTQDLLSMGVDESRITTIDGSVEPIFRRIDIEKKRTIGCVGQLQPRKNMKDSVLAFSELVSMDGMEDMTLRIVGKGPEEQDLRDYAQSLGISDRVEFLKDLDEDELVRFYNECLLVLNTSLHEGLGLVTLEAQACGTPVLHLAHAHIPEKVTRTSIPCDSPEDMAEKAHMILTDVEKYTLKSKESEEYVSEFNLNRRSEYLSAVFGDQS